jgi:CRP-like cAMP-binding protein
VQLDESAAAGLRARGEARSLGRGERLFGQHDPPGPVALIEAGRIRVTSSSEDGAEVLLAMRGPGELLGEFAALDGLPRSATATAVSDGEVTLVPAESFLDWLRTSPDVMYSLLLTLVGKIRDADVSRLELSANEIDHRVLLRLGQLAHERGEEAGDSEISITPPLTPEELASFTGALPDAVARSLDRLAQLGIVRATPDELRIVKPDALAPHTAR